MPNILKIIGKSVLCFIGLAVVSCLVYLLTDWIVFMHPKPYFFVVVYITIFAYIFWFLLPLVYTYLLFSVFKKEKYCYSIIVSNSIFVIIQFYILLVFHTEPESSILLISLYDSMVAGIPVILLATMFKKLKEPYKKIKLQSDHRRIRSILGILARSALCFIALLIGVYGYRFLGQVLYSPFIKPITYFSFLSYFLSYIQLCIYPLIAIAYAYMLFKLMRKYRNRNLIMIFNSIFLLIVWSLIYFDEVIKIDLPSICGNTALITIVLMFIFRSVEKRGSVRNRFEDSSVANAPSE